MLMKLQDGFLRFGLRSFQLPDANFLPNWWIYKLLVKPRVLFSNYDGGTCWNKETLQFWWRRFPSIGPEVFTGNLVENETILVKEPSLADLPTASSSGLAEGSCIVEENVAYSESFKRQFRCWFPTSQYKYTEFNDDVEFWSVIADNPSLSWLKITFAFLCIDTGNLSRTSYFWWFLGI
jgi:hypothetical protein